LGKINAFELLKYRLWRHAFTTENLLLKEKCSKYEKEDLQSRSRMPLSDLLATTDPMRLHWYSGLLCETFVLRQGKHAFAIFSLYFLKGIKYYAAYSNE